MCASRLRAGTTVSVYFTTTGNSASIAQHNSKNRSLSYKPVGVVRHKDRSLHYISDCDYKNALLYKSGCEYKHRSLHYISGGEYKERSLQPGRESQVIAAS